MPKLMHSVKLTGLVKSGNKWIEAQTHQADEVCIFKGVDAQIGTFYIHNHIEGEPVLHTAKGKYPMLFNKAGYFEPSVVMPCKIHVTLKKITGKLIYWA